MRKSISKVAAALVFSLLAVVSVSGCAIEKTDMTKYSAVIDVRTPAEFAAGHLEGAQNIDVESATFATEIDALDKSANYFVYCHSGRRAGMAVDYMSSHGFTGELLNAGGIDAASSSSGLAITTN